MIITTWRLRQGADRRARAGHPWIFSNELQQSPKGHPVGETVRLLDHRGEFVAMGYGNPHSLIAFRALSFNPNEQADSTAAYVTGQLVTSWINRERLGYRYSFRWAYGENDSIPGLVIDRYRLAQGQVFAVQVLTAGMEKIMGSTVESVSAFLEKVNERLLQQGCQTLPWSQTAVVLRNDVNIRKLEGLSVCDVKWFLPEGTSFSEQSLREAEILIRASGAVNESEAPVKMNCDLIDGQKTGFFLDQAHNIELLCQVLQRMEWTRAEKKTIKVLDLCCYVGHWSTQITRVLRAKGYEVETTLADVSMPALQLAKKNAEREGAKVVVLQCDVLEDLVKLPNHTYDIVIADPPAFIKAKKDVPTGKHAYLKLNTQAFRLVKSKGLVVSSSCSGLYVEEEMRDTLRKAMQRSNVQAPCIVRGGHGPDHPCSMSFPEGFYLKMFLHQIS